MASIKTFTNRLSGVLESIGDWYERVLKEDEEYYDGSESYPPDESCYLHDPDAEWISDMRARQAEAEKKKVYDDSLVAKAAEEYPGEWTEVEHPYHKGCFIKYAVKRDANDDLFFKVIDLNDEYLMRYVDAGKVYLATKHKHWEKYNTHLWEIPPEIMKRDVSQFLIQYEDHNVDEPFWSVELDM